MTEKEAVCLLCNSKHKFSLRVCPHCGALHGIKTTPKDLNDQRKVLKRLFISRNGYDWENDFESCEFWHEGAGYCGHRGNPGGYCSINDCPRVKSPQYAPWNELRAIEALEHVASTGSWDAMNAYIAECRKQVEERMKVKNG